MLKTIHIKCFLVKETGLACSIASFTGTHKGPITSEGKKIPLTIKKFQVDFCTVAHWKNGQIDEENLFYDNIGMRNNLAWLSNS
jgi:hypothetical protein